jgi:hypothetical protein
MSILHTDTTTPAGKHRSADAPAHPLRDPAGFRRHQIPADGGWYTFRVSGPVLAAYTRYAGVIEFTTLHTGDGNYVDREFAVFHDGQTLPDPIPHHRGTVVTGTLIWHLMER